MTYEMKGTIKRISSEKVLSDKFTMKEFILHIPGQYPQDIKFQLANKRMALVDESMIGKEATVHFNIYGQATKTGYWNTLSCWKIELNQGTKYPEYDLQPVNSSDILDGDEPF
jgi:hypothetical protein